MIKINNILNVENLEKEIIDGYISRRPHNIYPLAILNYTAQAQYENKWNTETKICRGLVYDINTLEVINRVFIKFFNFGDSNNTGQLDLDEEAIVTDKLDGSMISLGIYNDIPILASRGSFESPQAIHATNIWNTKYNNLHIPRNLTLLFEVIYSENRIVVDYENMDDLVLLGGVYNDTGLSIGPNDEILEFWTGPRAQQFEYKTLKEALEATPRKNKEGLVVHLLKINERIKIKQEDYIALHKIVTGLNEKTIWEHLSKGGNRSELIEKLPDEFHEWTTNIANKFNLAFSSILSEVMNELANIMVSFTDRPTRKEFAMFAKNSQNSSILFCAFDEKTEMIKKLVWEKLKPIGKSASPRMIQTEDNL